MGFIFGAYFGFRVFNHYSRIRALLHASIGTGGDDLPRWPPMNVSDGAYYTISWILSELFRDSSPGATSPTPSTI